jgi:F-type H+-transporting ATPase subunit delta
MNQGLIPRRYAKALIEHAAPLKADDKLYELMQQLTAVFAATPELQSTLANPHVSDADKLKLIATAAGGDAAAVPVLADFIKLLQQNKRLGSLRDIALAYVDLYRKAKSIHRVVITSAAPLADAELQRMHHLVDAHLPAGATAEYLHEVNPELIGGFTIAIDHEELDASLANDFKQLRLKLLSH